MKKSLFRPSKTRGIRTGPASVKPYWFHLKGAETGTVVVKPKGRASNALLRMNSKRHAVASKVIATVDDLEQIAADDHADVAALHGWRRDLFGEAALSLKHGRLALAIERGRVVRVDRS